MRNQIVLFTFLFLCGIIESKDNEAKVRRNMNNYEKKKKMIMALAYLHRYGWIAILFGCIAIFPRAVFMIFGVGFIADAIWSFVGYKCRWKHIFCSYQNAYRLPMTPNNIRWGWVKKSDAYGIPIIMFTIGMSCIIMFFVNLR